MAFERGPSKSICPSEVSRRLNPLNWRRLMPEVRKAAGILIRKNKIAVLQKGIPVDPEKAKGPIRIKIK